MDGIKFFFPTVIKDIIVLYYKNVSPGVVTTSDPFPPTGEPHVLVPENLQDVPYTFEFWTTDDGVTPLTKITSWSIEGGRISSGEMQGFYHYVVGRGDSGVDPLWADPAPGDRELHDERLQGQKIVVIMRGTGPRRPDEVPELPTGGFSFSNPDETFQDEDTITILVLGAGSSGSNNNNNPGSTEAIKIVTASGAVDNSYYNKRNVAVVAGLITTQTFPLFNAIPANTTMSFSTYAFTAANRYWALQFANGDEVAFMGKNRNVIHLGSHEFIRLYFYDDGTGNIKCLVESYSGYYDRVGDRLNSDHKDRLNTFLADGEVEYNKADFPRLFTELTPDQIVDYNTWGTAQQVNVAGNVLTKYPNKRKFAVNDLTGKFKFPDRRGMTTRVLDSFTGASAGWLTQGPGGFSPEELLGHDHDIDIKGMNLRNEGSSGSDYSGSGNTVHPLKTKKTGGAAQRVDSEGVYGLIGI